MTVARRLTIPAFALVVGTALAVDPSGWASFVTLRWAVISTASLALIAGVLGGGELRVHRASLVGWLAFVAWAALAGVAALDPLYTWIGTPDRHLGVLAVALFAGLYWAGQRFGERSHAMMLLRAAVLAQGAIGLYTVFELLDRPLVQLDTATSRPGGPFGTAAYLGAACALLIPLCVGAAIDGLDAKRWRNAAWLCSGLGVVAALAAQTRAGWVGLIVGALISLPALTTWLRRRWRTVIAAAVGLVVVATISPIGDRALGAFDFAGGTARGRIDEWQVGARVAVNHPVLGVGMEGYRIAFAEGVDADYERRYSRATMPDRAHSGPLDVAVTTGLPGMALYLAVVAFLVSRSLRAVRSRQPWLAGIGAAVTGYLAQQLFLFPITEVDPVFWLFAGALVAATGQEPSVLLRTRPWIAAVVWALAAGAAIVGILDVAADRRSFAAATTTLFPQQALADADAAVALRPDSIRYRAIAANVAARSLGGDGLSEAIERIDGALHISPLDPILRETKASLHLRLARETQDEGELQTAISLFEALIAEDPVHARYRFELGGAYAIVGNDAGAIEQLRAAAHLAPQATAPLVRLVEVLAGVGMRDEALEVIAELAARGLEESQLAQLRRLLDG